MGDTAFAALIASSVAAESRIGTSDWNDEEYNPAMQFLENLAPNLGCIASGHILKPICWDSFTPGECVKYALNQFSEDELANPMFTFGSVGIGNMKLANAAALWQQDEYVYRDIQPLRVSTWYGEVDIPNPFDTWYVSAPMGTAGTHQPTTLESYKMLARQLLDERYNIEYTAAHLEEGAIRMQNLEQRPTAYMLAAWRLKGFLTPKQIAASDWNPGAAGWIVEHMSEVLNIWGLSSNWRLDQMNEPEFYAVPIIRTQLEHGF
jgi:hypothetical protein